MDVSDSFGAPKTYTFTGSPGQVFKVTLTVTPAQGNPLVATKDIIIDNKPPTIQVSSSVTNGHAPLAVTFSVMAQDPQGIKQISIDFDGDGVFDAVQDGNNQTSGSWSFQTSYQNEGYYLARVKVTDMFGAETQVTNNAITVDVNNPQDPVVQFTASSVSGNSPLTVSLRASATIFDNSTVAKWRWDLDGDGNYETMGGTSETDIKSFTYRGIKYHYPAVEVITQTGRSARASLRIKTIGYQKPTLTIPNSSDTINTDAMQIATFRVDLPYETELEVWIENSDGQRMKTIYPKQLTPSGNREFNWDGKDEQSQLVSEGDYYVVLGYSEYGVDKEIDLRTSTGGRLSYYGRNRANPRYFNRIEEPLRIDYAVDDPAEVSFFWQISFGERLMTLMEHERMGRGQYSLYWNGEFPSGQKIPDNLNRLMPGIVRYTLPDNVIFVKSMPRIENFVLKSTVIADPRIEPIEFDITMSKTGTVELVISDMDKGVDVARRIYPELSQGQHTLVWDGKNDDGKLLYPGDYRMGVRSVDKKGSRSLFWYRTQRIYY